VRPSHAARPSMPACRGPPSEPSIYTQRVGRCAKDYLRLNPIRRGLLCQSPRPSPVPSPLPRRASARGGAVQGVGYVGPSARPVRRARHGRARPRGRPFGARAAAYGAPVRLCGVRMAPPARRRAVPVARSAPAPFDGARRDARGLATWQRWTVVRP
jgi:hypothetical protein